MARLEEGAEEAFKAQAAFGALKEPFPVSNGSYKDVYGCAYTLRIRADQWT